MQKQIIAGLALVFASLVLTISAAAKEPSRIMILVFDQTRPDYIDRFDLKNFKRARAMGVRFENGIVGHLESVTILSHPVMTTGIMPKNLPWQGHIIKDTRGIYGEKGKFYTPFDVGVDGWMKGLKETAGDSSIIARVKKKYGGKSLAVAQKKYAAVNFGGPYADRIVYMGSVVWEGPYKGSYQPEGINVPDYISKDKDGRFYVDALNDWGSGEMVYPFHGNVFLEGNDPKRLGGDAWVGDVVEKYMENEKDWSAILASFGSIDKVAHVLHEHNGPTNYLWAKKHGISLADTAKKADKELGRILDRLEKSALLDSTAIVITADHGGQYSRHFHGTNESNKHVSNLYYGKSENFDARKSYPTALKPVYDTGVVEIASHNTMLSFWLKDNTPKKSLERFYAELKKAPGVSEIYRKNRNRKDFKFENLFRSNNLKGNELKWANARNQDLLFSLEGEVGPDVVAFLFDGHGYDVPGSHGGNQELVQRIPYTVISPNLKKKGVISKDFVRLVDVNPTLAKLLSLPSHPKVDGSDKAISKHLIAPKK